MKKITVHLDKSINDKYKSVSIMTTAEFSWFMKGLMEQHKIQENNNNYQVKENNNG